MWNEHIEINPRVLTGKPVIKNTRLAVEFILQMLAAGVSMEEILANYPALTREDILACIAYAVDIVSSEQVYPLSA